MSVDDADALFRKRNLPPVFGSDHGREIVIGNRVHPAPFLAVHKFIVPGQRKQSSGDPSFFGQMDAKVDKNRFQPRVRGLLKALFSFFFRKVFFIVSPHSVGNTSPGKRQLHIFF